MSADHQLHQQRPAVAAKELSRASTPQWLSRVVLNWLEVGAIIAIAGYYNNLVVYFICLIALGTRQHALTVMLHDAGHYNAAKNRTLNDWLACLVVFWPMGIGVDGYRKFHFHHHRATGCDDDPEIVFKKKRGREWATPMTSGLLSLHVLKDFLGCAVYDMIHLAGLAKPASTRDVLGPILVWGIALSTMYMSGTLWIAVFWMISMNSSYWAVFRLRAWTEHMGTSGTHRIRPALWQRILFLPHNTWCHYEHHMWPAIPCWNLPKARELDKTEPIQEVNQLFRSFKNYPKLEGGQPKESPVHPHIKKRRQRVQNPRKESPVFPHEVMSEM